MMNDGIEAPPESFADEIVPRRPRKKQSSWARQWKWPTIGLGLVLVIVVVAIVVAISGNSSNSTTAVRGNVVSTPSPVPSNGGGDIFGPSSATDAPTLRPTTRNPTTRKPTMQPSFTLYTPSPTQMPSNEDNTAQQTFAFENLALRFDRLAPLTSTDGGAVMAFEQVTEALYHQTTFFGRNLQGISVIANLSTVVTFQNQTLDENGSAIFYDQLLSFQVSANEFVTLEQAKSTILGPFTDGNKTSVYIEVLGEEHELFRNVTTVDKPTFSEVLLCLSSSLHNVSMYVMNTSNGTLCELTDNVANASEHDSVCYSCTESPTAWHSQSPSLSMYPSASPTNASAMPSRSMEPSWNSSLTMYPSTIPTNISIAPNKTMEPSLNASLTMYPSASPTNASAIASMGPSLILSNPPTPQPSADATNFSVVPTIGPSPPSTSSPEASASPSIKTSQPT